MSDTWRELGELLKEAGATVRIGLRQQGHLPTVERMRVEGRSWDEIGEAIGWTGHAVERWYAMESVPRCPNCESRAQVVAQPESLLMPWRCTECPCEFSGGRDVA